jgi:hypothetical protein
MLVPPSITIILLISCRLIQPGDNQPQIQNPAATVEPTAAAQDVPSLTSPGIEVGQQARLHLQALTDIGARPPGSDNEHLAAEYIHTSLAHMDYQPAFQEFTANSNLGIPYTSQNVIAVKDGDSAMELLIGAHYDSANAGLGADDNASGVAVLLETAQRIHDMPTPFSIRFITFGSEENGLDGSTYFAQNMSQAEVENSVAMINLDSLSAGNLLYVYSDEGEDAFLRDWVLEWADGHDLPLQTIHDAQLSEDGNYYSDFGSFKERGIPFIYFEATDWTLGGKDGWTQVDPRFGRNGYIWHTPFDTLEYLDATFPERVNEHLRIFVSLLVAITTEFNETLETTHEGQ